MSSRWYPIYQRGNPQLRVFLPNFWMKMVKKETVVGEGAVAPVNKVKTCERCLKMLYNTWKVHLACNYPLLSRNT